MRRAGLIALLCGVGMAGVGTAWTQQQPTAYTVTVVNSMLGSPMEQTIYRNGSKAVIDTNSPAQSGGVPATHVRSLYDLSAHTNQSWDLVDSSGGCSSGTFSGDWGDPFAGLVDVSTGKMTGTETVNGFATKVYVVNADGATAKVWVDAKTGLPVRVDLTQGTDTKTITQVTKFTVGAPAASVFVVPANCTAAGGPPPVSERDKDIAAETGGLVGDFVDAVMTTAPGSQESCSVAIRVMKAGSMTPITGGFKLTANVIDDAKWAQGDTSPGANVPVTAGANGVWRIAIPPPHFNMTEDFGNAGGGGGMIHLQCWRPVSTLLLVVKDPQNLGKGADWVWDTKGKYAVK
jgi:outer membrane lipoprotein-sorting protein